MRITSRTAAIAVAAVFLHPAGPAEAKVVKLRPAEQTRAKLTFDVAGLPGDKVRAAKLRSGRVRRAVRVTRIRTAVRRGVLRVHRRSLRPAGGHIAARSAGARTKASGGRTKLLVRLDTKPPRTSITSAPSGTVSSTGASVAFTADEPATFACRLDAAAWQVCSSPLRLEGLAPGEHLLEVRATDRAGNVDATPAAARWTVSAPAAPAPDPDPAPAPEADPAPAPEADPAPAPPAGVEKATTREVGSPPLSDADAASRVRRSDWEPRPQNAAANQRVPTASELETFRATSSGWTCNGSRERVTGNFTGTTDEIIQWASWKWGVDEDVMRAVAVAESYWRQDAHGDIGNGESWGLTQVKQRSHQGTYPLSLASTAFNVDYYGMVLRYYVDGCAGWLNNVERGETYAAGDFWGSVGAWYAGRWHTAAAETYIAKIKDRLNRRVWEQPGF